MARVKFIPVPGCTYANAGGGTYKCISRDKNGFWMQNTVSGWTCLCVGLGVYPDGKIDWDYSKNGYFACNNNP